MDVTASGGGSDYSKKGEQQLIELIKEEIDLNYNTWIFGISGKGSAFNIMTMKETQDREKFLNQELKMIGQTLGIDFNGNSIDEKEAFYLQHKDALNAATNKILDQIYIAQTAKVIQFGNGSTETDWVVAESIEQAIDFYKLTTSITDEGMKAIQAKELNTEVEFKLLSKDEIPAGEQQIFKKSKTNEDLFEVPLVYAVEYALQKGMKLPCIIQSFE